MCRASPQDVAANGVNGGGRKEPPTMRNQGKEQAHTSRKVTELIVTPISVPGTQRRSSRGLLLLCRVNTAVALAESVTHNIGAIARVV